MLLDAKGMASKLAQQTAEIELLRQQLELSRQLGFADDSGHQVESIKDQAIAASKNLRVLRFLMTNSPKVMSSLRSEGLTTLAKKVQNDVKLALSGHIIDLSDMIDEHSEIICKHLQKDHKLMSRLQVFIIC